MTNYSPTHSILCDGRAEGLPVLQRLIRTCQAGERDFRALAAGAKDELLRRLFRTYSLQRARFAAELENELSRCRGAAPDAAASDQSETEPAHEDLSLHSCCERDAQLVDRYQSALKAKLPHSSLFLVASQLSLVRQAHDRVRLMLCNQPANK